MSAMLCNMIGCCLNPAHPITINQLLSFIVEASIRKCALLSTVIAKSFQLRKSTIFHEYLCRYHLKHKTLQHLSIFIYLRIFFYLSFFRLSSKSVVAIFSFSFDENL